jgi:hypothetical protein
MGWLVGVTVEEALVEGEAEGVMVKVVVGVLVEGELEGAVVVETL